MVRSQPQLPHNVVFGDSNPGRERGRALFTPGASCQGHLALYEASHVPVELCEGRGCGCHLRA